MAACSFWNFNLNNIFYCSINGGVVHVDNLVAFLAVGFLNCALDGFDSFFLGQDAGDQEEGGLHDHVNAGAKTDCLGKLDSINNVELGLLIDKLFLDYGR